MGSHNAKSLREISSFLVTKGSAARTKVLDNLVSTTVHTVLNIVCMNNTVHTYETDF
jgi:hypothetical protein